MKRICLLMILSFSFNFLRGQTYSQNCNCEVEMNEFSFEPQVCPFKEELFCNQTKLFFQKSNLIPKVKSDYNDDKRFFIDINVDSLGRFINYYRDKLYYPVNNRIIDDYVNKVLKHFLWDISSMKVTEFHDNDNTYNISVWIIVNKKRLVTVETEAMGKYITSIYFLCKP